jgi:predicted HTH transcriptional regulator
VDADLSDLDLDAMSKLLGREMNERTLRSGNLARTEQGRTVPTNAGVLIGSPHPEQFLPHAWVQCARFRGPRKRDITDQADIEGPLPLAVDKVMEFLKRNAFLTAEFNGGPRRRKDVWSIPLEPLKELVVNALVHSSYSDHGTPIKVAFLDDEIRIESPGGLVPGMTIEQMKSGESSIRNPVLAAIFKELGFIETWGTGIPEALQDLAELGLTEPDFEEGHERLKITVHIQNHDPLRFRADQPGEQDVEQGKQDVEQVQGVLLALGRYGQRILAAASRRPVSRADIFEVIGLVDDYRAFARHIAPLVDSGLLERTIPDKPRAHTQRYVASAAGRAALDQVSELSNATGSD